METKRLSKTEYYLNIAKQVAERSTCFRNKGGAIIVKDDQIVATGYIGAPRKTRDCFERNECLRDKLKIPHGKQYEMCRSVHAEMNAIINTARAGVSLLGGDMYIYHRDKEGKEMDSLPCFICKKIIINCGLENVICSMRDKNVKTFKVEDWIADWQEKDIIDDEEQYGKDLNSIDGF
ncbi:MAG: deaminase [Candidatus Nealsonbacteria bacterium]